MSEELGFLKQRYEYVKLARAVLVELFGGKCAAAGCKEPFTELEFAHVKPTRVKGWGRGSLARLNDVYYHRDSYILLCKYHHQIYDQAEK